mmetsp:Transcript_4345/g.8686  ORF Transcript_4345/g.8686 Transcript_4345/m.8686 type:complete len:333 (+) Transcript_4345:55-1053(+)
MATKDLIAASSGAAGAAVSNALLYPLDILRAHLNKGSDEDGQQYQDWRDVVQRVLKRHGLPGFYKGLGTKTAYQVFQKFVYYYVYDALRRRIARVYNGKAIPFSVSIAVGYVAGVFTVMGANPLEVLATRQALDKQEDGGHAGDVNGRNRAGSTNSTLALLRRIIREEGASALYRGSTANVVLCINPAIENSLFDTIKDRFLHFRPGLRSLSMAQAFWLGALAKIIATAVTFPYIRAKVIIQASKNKSAAKTDAAGSSGGAAASTSHCTDSALRVIERIIREEGVHMLWRGMGPAATKSVLGSAMLLAAKEKIEVATKKTLLFILRSLSSTG